MRFPQDFIDELKKRADIVRVIQDYVQLKKKGNNWMACCPFHKEKTPSFSVSSAKEIFYCFSCHKGGSVFNFVMEIEGIGFPEAVRSIAQKSGMAVPVTMENETRYEVTRKESDQVVELNSLAMTWWETQLAVSGEGGAGRSYLLKRGLTEQICKQFHIGYAPDSWDALSNYLRQSGATTEQIESSGLVVKKETGGSYDRFRGRLMFPVLDLKGKPIAFGGRALKEGETKYINSPETASYVKGKHLFGLNFARDEIRRQGFAILVEGFLDVVVPSQYGVPNTIASLGTSLTPEQAKLLARFTKKVVINYDGDKPGIEAAKKAIEILLAEGIEVKVLTLPEGSDPDEFIRKHGAEAYHLKRGSALPYLNFVIHHATEGKNTSNPAEKETAVKEILPYIKAVPSNLQKREYFDMAMDAVKVTDPNLRRELWHSVQTGVDSSSSVYTQAFQPTSAEKRLLELMLSDEDLRRKVCPYLHHYLDDQFATGQLFTAICSLNDSGRDVNYDSLCTELENNSLATDWLPLLMMADPSDNTEKEAQSCLNALWLLTSSRIMTSLKTQIHDAERGGDLATRDRLAEEHLSLARKRNELLKLTGGRQ